MLCILIRPRISPLKNFTDTRLLLPLALVLWTCSAAAQLMDDASGWDEESAIEYSQAVIGRQVEDVITSYSIHYTKLYERDPHWPRIGEHFFSALDDDAAKAAGAIGLVLAQQTISSQLVDNLNATIHLRALLTDLFLADEALQGPET